MRLLLYTFAASAAAFPSMFGSPEELAEIIKRAPAPAPAPEPEPQLPAVGALLGSLTGTITGLLGQTAKNVNPSDKRPEKDYVFKAPGSGDSRGPCPGLNLLANYGYLPRSGLVTFNQIVDATGRGFNMSPDLASILTALTILADGDIATESFYLGTSPSGVGGLNRHSTNEADISINREDFYNGCGDNHHLSSRLFKQHTAIAAASSSKQFDLETQGNQFLLNSKFSQQYNPYLYYFPFPMIVSLGAFVFYPNFFSNGTYRAGGVANYESISTIIGANYSSQTNEFVYVPEKWPESWYRRSVPYTTMNALVDAFTYIYPKNPVTPGFSQLGTPNANARTLLCDFYQGINSIVPLFISGDAAQIGTATSWVLSKLDPYFGGTLLGCPPSTISPNNPPLLFRNANATGGPLKTPPNVRANTGNNVYGKTYFTTAPRTPAC